MKYLSKEDEIQIGYDIREMNLMLQSDLFDVEIWEKGREGVETLVRNNLRLVYKIANDFFKKNPQAGPLEDIIQEGKVGLMKAIEKYDPDRGYKFSTMAFAWIRQSVMRETNRTSRLVRLPENRVHEIIQINTLLRNVDEGISEKELHQYIQDELGISATDLHNILNANSLPVSINKVVSSEKGSPKELIEFLGEKDAENFTVDQVMAKDAFHQMKKALNKLPQVTQDVVLSVFAVANDSNEILKPSQVRNMHKLSITQYDKLKNQGLMALRENLTRQGYALTDFISA